MAAHGRDGIPVPREQMFRGRNAPSAAGGPAAASRSGRGQIGGGGGGGGAIGIGTRTSQRASQQGRGAPAAEASQAPWRSSLDLVWSYSRSQAFYGANFATSPSFVEHHWAGPSGMMADSSVDEQDEDEEGTSEGQTSGMDDDYDDDDDDDDDLEASATSLNYAARSRPSRALKYGATDQVGANADDDVITGSPAAPMDWQDEQLPPNAKQQSRGSANSSGAILGRRDKRRSMARSPRDPERRVLDRRLRRVADDSNEDDERSRSRSRSPKRVNVSKPSSSNLQYAAFQSDEDDDNDVLDDLDRNDRDRQRQGQQLKEARAAAAAQSQKDRSIGFVASERPSEATPLLRRARGTFRDDMESAGGARRKEPLHTPSWLRNSRVSTSSSRFRKEGYGTSTFWQSWFNTVNALVGVGILSLPLAISYAGLIPGVLLFLLCGLVTNYTGKVLANIMAAEPSLRTYADIGNLAFGPKAKLLVSFLFCLELWAVSTALIILFGDSVHALVLSSASRNPSGIAVHLAQWPLAAFKGLGILIVLPTIFLPLRLLSPVSVVGIISVVTLFGVVLADGIIKPEAPGSLRDPIAPQLGPQWMRLPLSFGLIMSGFSSHPIIPSLFKDMSQPQHFAKMLNWAYIGATIIYLGMGLIGYLMFGHYVSDEITRNLAHIKAYPRVLNTIALWLIIINPLSKFALAARPIFTTLELLLGVEQSQLSASGGSQIDSKTVAQQKAQNGVGLGASSRPNSSAFSTSAPNMANGQALTDGTTADTTSTSAAHEDHESDSETNLRNDAPDTSPLVGSMISIRAAQRTAGWSKQRKLALRVSVQIVVTLLIGITAIALPGFEKVMAFLGAFLACATCIFGPLLARMRLFRHEMSGKRIAMDAVILFISVVVAAVGTVWTFIASSSPAPEV